MMPWEKYQAQQPQQEGPWSKYQAPQATAQPWYDTASNAIKGAEDTIGNFVKPALPALGRAASIAAPETSPTGLLNSVPGLLNRGADYLGRKTSENLAQTGIVPSLFAGTPTKVSPLLAAGIGTGVAMAPDVIMSTVNPESEFQAPKTAPSLNIPLSPVAAEKPNLLSAIQLRGKTYVGAPGEIHADVINKMAQELGQDPGTVIDSIQKIGDQGFTNNGKFLSRSEVRGMTGERPEAASLLASGKMGSNPVPEIPASVPEAPILTPREKPMPMAGNEYAQDKALAAMGTPKRLLKSPQMVDKAREQAQILLDAGLVKPLRGTQGMADELANLEESSGQKIGSILDQMGDKGKVFDLQDPIDELNKLRPVSKSTGQILRGGAYDKINGKIDDAVATIQAHLPKLPGGGTMAQPLSFSEANDLKGVLQGLANYSSNKDATLLDKVIAGKFRESLDNSLEKAAGQIGNPDLSQEFQQAKKLYGATQFAKDPIYNKLSSELTNKKISLTDWILGSASLATGNPLTAALEVGGKKLLEKFGPSTQAYVSNALSKTPKLLGAANKAYVASRVLNQAKPLLGKRSSK